MAKGTNSFGTGAFGGVKAKKRFNTMLLGDLQKMQEGTLGLSDSEKNRVAEGAQMAAGAQAAAQQSDIQRAALAGGANPFTGHAAQLSRDIGQQAQGAAAQARVAADEMSTNLAATEAADIRARLERQRERQRRDAATAGRAVASFVGGAVGAGGGGGGGGGGAGLLGGFLKKATG